MTTVLTFLFVTLPRVWRTWRHRGGQSVSESWLAESKQRGVI